MVCTQGRVHCLLLHSWLGRMVNKSGDVSLFQTHPQLHCEKVPLWAETVIRLHSQMQDKLHFSCLLVNKNIMFCSLENFLATRAEAVQGQEPLNPGWGEAGQGYTMDPSTNCGEDIWHGGRGESTCGGNREVPRPLISGMKAWSRNRPPALFFCHPVLRAAWAGGSGDTDWSLVTFLNN